MVKSKWHVLVRVGVYVQEPLVGGQQTTCLLDHCFVVEYRVNEEQRVLHKLLVENLNDLPSSPDVGLVVDNLDDLRSSPDVGLVVENLNDLPSSPDVGLVVENLNDLPSSPDVGFD
jgi:hypothetical protein